jgi:hypothetical protein
MIKMSKFLQKNSGGNWNTTPPVSVEKIKNVNCHKFVLYTIGKISWEEMISDPSEQQARGFDFTFRDTIRAISDIPYALIGDGEDLTEIAQKECGVGKSCVGQILDAETGEMAHSFMVTRESENNYICFDKPGFKYPFAVSDLNTILNFVNKDGEQSNKDQKWRFIPLDSIK